MGHLQVGTLGTNPSNGLGSFMWVPKGGEGPTKTFAPVDNGKADEVDLSSIWTPDEQWDDIWMAQTGQDANGRLLDSLASKEDYTAKVAAQEKAAPQN